MEHNFDLKSKGKQLEPNNIFPTMNQHADNVATWTMNALKSTDIEYCTQPNFPNQSTALYNPIGLDFYISINGKTCDSKSNRSIGDACIRELKH